MGKSFIVSRGIVVLFILVGVYFFTHGNEADDLITKRNKLQSNLAVAEDKFDKEKQTLGTMIKNFQNASELTLNVREQMEKAADIVKQTDFMFTNPYGFSPALITKNLLVYILINDERKNINQLLSEWQQKIGVTQNIDLGDSDKIKKDAEIIKAFIEDLSKIVGALTPQNSGLSQTKIDNYLSNLPSVESINAVLAALGTATESYNSNYLQIPDTIYPITENNQDPSSSTPSGSIFDSIVAQQVIVTETQTEVTNIQQQLTQIIEQIQQSPPPPATSLPVEIDTTINPDSGNQTTDSTNNINNYVTPYIRDLSDYQGGIIIQPGPPRLIQGTDQY